MAETMGLDGAGGSGLELKAVLDEVERLVICMVTETIPPVPAEAGEAVRDASRERLVHDGAAPDMVKPPSVETETDEKASVESEADAAGTTLILKRRLWSGVIRLEVDPLLHEPLACCSPKVIDPADTEFTHQPTGGTVEALNEYFAVSILKVIDLILLDGPLFVTVTGITACGSAITTSVPAGAVRENVSARAEANPA